jgi:hypothetical protein
VPVEPTSWPEDKAERISVNSYGIGGSNSHVSNFPGFPFDFGFSPYGGRATCLR